MFGVFDFAGFDSIVLPPRREPQRRHQPISDARRPLCRTSSLSLCKLDRVSGLGVSPAADMGVGEFVVEEEEGQTK